MSTNLRNPADRRDYPARWTMRRGKELFREIDERSADGSEELLSVSHITGITPRSQKNVTMFQSESLVGYKICRPGDIAANTMWTWQGAIGVSDYFGVISPSYNVYRQRQDTYNPRYLDFLLREPKLVDVYYSLSTGIRPSRRRLYPDEFLTIRFPVPPRAEQDKIVRFLDEKANAIDEVIATRQKQIDELHELRKTIINRAVTRGICAGGLGTGTLPSRWKAVRLKSIVSLSSEKTANSRLRYIGMENVESWTGKYVQTEDILPEGISNVFHEGDVLFGKLRPYLAKAYVPCGDGICSSEFLVLTPKGNITIRHLFYLLISHGFIDDVNSSTYGAKMPRANWGYIGNMRIPLPPVDEQREIAAYLDEKCAAIDKAIENRKAAIEELIALKARIVADAVTGRMEVE